MSKKIIGSTDALMVAFENGKFLSDAEFRFLILMAECPVDGGFETSIDFMVEQGMDFRNAECAAARLAATHAFYSSDFDTQFFCRGGKCEWRFYSNEAFK